MSKICHSDITCSITQAKNTSTNTLRLQIGIGYSELRKELYHNFPTGSKWGRNFTISQHISGFPANNKQN